MNKKSIGAFLLSAALLMGGTATTFAYFTNSANTNTQYITLGNVAVEFTPVSGTSYWGVIGRGVTSKDTAMDIDPSCTTNWINTNVESDGTTLGNGYDEICRGDVNSISHVAPGDVLCKSFTLKNTGSLDAKVTLSIDNLNAETPLIEKDLINNCRMEAFCCDRTGKLNKVFVGVDPTGRFYLDAIPGETITVYAKVYFASSIDNTAMNKGINFNVKADATQWNNPGWAQ